MGQKFHWSLRLPPPALSIPPLGPSPGQPRSLPLVSSPVRSSRHVAAAERRRSRRHRDDWELLTGQAAALGCCQGRRAEQCSARRPIPRCGRPPPLARELEGLRAGSHLGKQVGKDVGEGVGGWGQVLPPAVAGASTSPPAGLPRPDASPWLARGAAPPFLPHAATQPQPPAGGTTTVATAAATADGPRLPRSGAAPGPAR